MELDDKIYKPATVIAAISNAKNALISPDMYITDSTQMSADESEAPGARCYIPCILRALPPCRSHGF